MGLYLLSKEKITERKVLLVICMIVFLLAFLLTFSRVAFMTLVLAAALYYVVSEAKIAWKYILPVVASILLFLVVFNFFDVFAVRLDLWSDSAFQEREMYMGISRNMFLDKPFGVGAGDFTYLMQDYTSVKLMPWQFQPVHNILLLVSNEMGVQGVAVFLLFLGYLFYLLMNYLKRGSDKVFACVLIALWSVIFVGGMFDHYFVSLYQGQALLFLFAGFVGVCSEEMGLQ
jgi:O-antigen ligase